MLSARVAAHAWRIPGTGDVAADLRAGRSRAIDGQARIAEPERPAEIPVGAWRRMSRLTRCAADVACALRAARPDLAWEDLPVLWGSALGEVVPSSDFLDRLIGEGPQFASPLAFQGSVYNATPGQLSLALGLRGPTETVSAGMATGLAALARGIEWLADAPAVLVLVGDDLNRTTEAAYGAAGLVGGEAVVGVILVRGDGVGVADGVHASDASRAVALPYERGFVQLGRPIAPERTLGLCCTGGLVAVLSGISATDQDGTTALTARQVDMPPSTAITWPVR